MDPSELPLSITSMRSGTSVCAARQRMHRSSVSPPLKFTTMTVTPAPLTAPILLRCKS